MSQLNKSMIISGAKLALNRRIFWIIFTISGSEAGDGSGIISDPDPAPKKQQFIYPSGPGSATL